MSTTSIIWLISIFCLVNVVFRKDSNTSMEKHGFLMMRRTTTECINENTDVGPSYEGNDINISHCFFLRILSCSESGGVFRFWNRKLVISVSDTLFVNCSTESRGGVISCTSNWICFLRVCSSGCLAKLGGHFSDTKYSVNLHELFSVSLSSRQYIGSYTIYNDGGLSNSLSCNFTDNKCEQYSFMYISEYQDFNFDHCLFSKNKILSSHCISISECPGRIIFTCFIHNDSPKDYLIFGRESTIYMKYCIFYDNHDKLLFSYNKYITVYDSFISHSEEELYLGDVLILSINNSFTKREIYDYVFFSPVFCYEHHFTPRLTPKESPIKTPKRTAKETPTFAPTMTLRETPQESPIRTPKMTPEITSSFAPTYSLKPTCSIRMTMAETPERTPIQTLKFTPVITTRIPDSTPIPTAESIERNENSIFGSIEPFHIAVGCVILMIICSFFLYLRRPRQHDENTVIFQALNGY